MGQREKKLWKKKAVMAYYNQTCEWLESGRSEAPRIKVPVPV